MGWIIRSGELGGVIDTLIEAVRNGELDAVLGQGEATADAEEEGGLTVASVGEISPLMSRQFS